MYCAALPSLPVRLVRQGMHTRRINPPVVEVEKRAHCNGVVDGFVGPPRCVEEFDIGFLNAWGLLIYLTDESE